MSVRCSACGREYDVTLFQFGRTVDCDCGRRVALDAQVALPSGRSPEEDVDDDEDEGREAGAGDRPHAPGAEP